MPPFGSRSSGCLIDILGMTDTAEGFERERDWARDCWNALAPHHSGVHERRYDPENIFHVNQNIQPGPD